MAGFAPAVQLTATGALRVNNPLSFTVSAQAADIEGQLFSSAAVIRFTPLSAVLSFGDGSQSSGPIADGSFRANHSFGASGNFWVQSRVSYRVDYQIGSADWVFGAAVIEVWSNQLLLELIEPKRRTLLVG
jgi:hypothetical protein